MQRLTGDPRRVEVFVRAVEHGSFSSLARARHLKPSSVSRQISQLEEELGVRLIARTTRKLHLTEAGAVLYERGRAALDDLDDAFRAAAALATAPRGRLRMSVPVAFGRRYVAPLLRPFSERFPHLDLDVALHERFVDLVGEGYDVAVRAGHVRDEGLVARRLAANDRVVVAAPDYVARAGIPCTPDALTGHTTLVFRYVDATDEWRFRKDGREMRVRVRPRLASNNGDLLLETAVAGMGLALLPCWLAADAIDAGQLQIVLPAYEATATDFDSELHLVYPTRRFVPAKVRVLLSFLQEQFSPPPWLGTKQGHAVRSEEG